MAPVQQRIKSAMGISADVQPVTIPLLVHIVLYLNLLLVGGGVLWLVDGLWADTPDWVFRSIMAFVCCVSVFLSAGGELGYIVAEIQIPENSFPWSRIVYIVGFSLGMTFLVRIISAIVLG